MKKVTIKRLYQTIIFLLPVGILIWLIFPHYIFAIDDWKSINKMVARVQHDLPFISTDELYKLMATKNENTPLIIDVRDEREFKVSHLYGAINMKDANKIISLLREPQNKQRTVVVYCSVGYRSAIVGNDIKKTVSNKVFNLKGSIFKWANEGKPVYRNDLKVNKVHPYDHKWGKFLRTDMWPDNFK